MAEEADDLAGDIRAAMNELKGEGAVATAPTTETAAPAEVNQTAAKDEASTSEGPARDEHGRFARKEGTLSLAKPAEIVQSVDNQPAQAVEPEQPAIHPPHSLKAAVKAIYGTLPKEVQEEFLRLEKTFQDGKTEWSSKAERLNRFDSLITPIKERLALSGVDEHTYIGRLVAADQMLSRDVRAGLAQIAQMYGLDLSQVMGMQPQSAEPPELASLREELSTLKQSLAQQQQASERAELDKSRQELEAFRSKPENMYFENVRPQMVRLLESGLAENLQDAYDKAVRLDPEVWPLIQRAQSDAASKAHQAQEHTRRALAAAGSVTGSPSPGGSPSVRSDPNATVADDVRAALAEVAGRI